ncbi:transcriptional regulator GlxA family with amidase domain [Methylobacterium brachiatum]|uniref:Transcriptional regulator GlxA family with amidase domain n=1 Tax=Methylobacterium brachiatum TaxID=269660 RepID=A0AAJ1WUT6_9HYPH|nr:DJ-1/PfpI family protein [Methylobacterium brachiatum]MCB4802072.1 DJ-1/PfpI family protein [Methylobacterium brachiatum]MDQ0542412.1 transcriptional regulator GlxA family with amidase domain [Methylobacterium brachiatum]
MTSPDLSRRAMVAAAAAAAAFGPVCSEAADAPGPIPQDRPVRIAMVLYAGMTALDLVGPQALLAGLAPGSLYCVAQAEGPVASDTGLSLVATHTFAACPPDLDVLFVPGGDGTPDQMRDAALLAFLRARAPRTAWVTSVCTGSLILGAAGLLNGYRATSHWCVRDAVLPLLGAVPVAERVVFDRNRATGAGISAGLDLALALAARLRGPDYARTAQLVAEYAPEPPFRAGTPAQAGPAILRAADAILAPLVAGATEAARG